MPRTRTTTTVDLAACACLDLGHHWLRGPEGVMAGGRLRGIPARVLWCDGCTSKRLDILGTGPRGRRRVIERRYDLDPAYKAALQALAEHHVDRRPIYRDLVAQRAKDSGNLIDSEGWDRGRGGSVVLPLTVERRRGRGGGAA